MAQSLVRKNPLCRNGHDTRELGTYLDGGYLRCAQCVRDRVKEGYRDNPERHRANAREYARRNRKAAAVRKRAWQKANPEKARAHSRKMGMEHGYRYSLRRKYGLSLEEYEALYEKQGGRCAVCRKPQAELGRRLCVDHCHETGKVRGLLCFGCNTGLGKLGDGALIEAAAEYLKGAE